MDIAPYVGGESKAPGQQRVIKLSSNENPFGPSPKAIEAIKNTAALSHFYPDGHCTELRAALGRKHGIDPARIVCGAGSDELIYLLCRSYLGQGDELLYTEHGFLVYSIAAQSCGAVPVKVAEKNLTADIDALAAAVTPRTKMVFVANPNNPTGSWLNRDDVRRLRAKLPGHVMLVLDSAYAEFADDAAYSAGHELVEESGNTVVLRTFSKIYGMGGLRLGWAHCPDDIADVLNRVRGPFNVSSAAQVAGLAALGDDDFVLETAAHTKACREKTAQRLTALGLTVYPSAGNFLLVAFSSPEAAENCRLFLKQQGILVRQMGAYGLPGCLRISIGLDDEMDLACDAIKSYVKTA